MIAWQELGKRYRSHLQSVLPDWIELDFIEGEHFSLPGEAVDLAWSGKLELKTGAHPPYKFKFEMWNDYLAKATVAQQIERVKRGREVGSLPELLIFARYLPRATAERLAEAGVNFLDLAGNINLALGSEFQKTVIGKRGERAVRTENRFTPGYAKLLFTLKAEPGLLRRNVREVAESAGISKSHVANALRTLAHRGLIQRDARGMLHLAGPEDVDRQLVQSYDMVLRPHLLVGRFRSPHADLEDLRRSLDRYTASRGRRWSLTGAAAAERINHFYKGGERVVFLELGGVDDVRELRLELRALPDRTGELTILRSFGPVCSWRAYGGVTVAHPWLVYAELLCSTDPRAQDAASHLRHSHPEWY